MHNTFALLSASVLYACQDAAVPVVATIHNGATMITTLAGRKSSDGRRRRKGTITRIATFGPCAQVFGGGVPGQEPFQAWARSRFYGR